MAESYMKTLIEELSKVLSPDNVFGQPIEQEDKMIIPVVKVSLGLGSGSGKGEAKEGTNEGQGGGGGAGVEPVAVITVFKGVPGPEGVKVMQLKPPSQMEDAVRGAVSAFARARGVAGAFSKKKEKKEAERGGEEEEATEE